jgi:hypothetical protein
VITLPLSVVVVAFVVIVAVEGKMPFHLKIIGFRAVFHFVTRLNSWNRKK